MTSWIDGSFVYSSQEAWVSTLRSFQNGTLKWMEAEGETRMPPYNLARVPLFNEPSPHVLRRLTPERMFGKREEFFNSRYKGLEFETLAI